MGPDIPFLFPGRVMEEEYWMETMECWIGGGGGGGGGGKEYRMVLQY